MTAAARALTVASLSLTLSGCLAQPAVTVDSQGPLRRDEVIVKPGRPGFVVAAPQGVPDPHAADLAVGLARRTGFGLVVADSSPPAYPAYERRVQEAAQGRLTFYAEIHGDGQRDGVGRIEVAGAGVDREFAHRLRFLFEVIREAHIRTRPSTPRLEVVVEPADGIFPASWSARRDGLPGAPARALRIGMPRLAHADIRDSYLSVLSDFLAQAATLPVGR